MYIYLASRARQNNHSSRRIRIVLGLAYWSQGCIPFCGGDLSSNSSVSFKIYAKLYQNVVSILMRHKKKQNSPYLFFFSPSIQKQSMLMCKNPKRCQWDERPLWSRITFYKHFWSQCCGLCAEMRSREMYLNKGGLNMSPFYPESSY